ncbi:uncharacterized protein LOC110842251 [Folsomia candida]|uniref:Uncharacterized protein n=1 Tax=Folsomia candida TaxID=158441 RepID=A0A226EWP9_FOLCA|nr:uncharacterized protein LOC110842251 [Folsomia candida]OXA61610.1 hypothetical protein Fcan01_02092 [Folsomia candida]
MRVVLPIRDFKFFISVYFVIALIGLSMASIYEDEDRVNSEGMWQKPSKHLEPKMSASTGQGNSRFDVGGILTAAGLKTGGSLLGLVVFPFIFPVVALLSIALFIISVFGGASPMIASGRRVDNNAKYGLAARIVEVLGSEDCVERIGCEIFDMMGHKTKLLRLLRKLNYFPEPDKAAGATGQSCSIFKCGVRDLIARTWG